MKHAWTIFAAALVWIGGGMFAAAAPPSVGVDLRVLCERYYQQAKWASPAADDAPAARMTLLLPGAPRLTAANVPAPVAPALLDADYGWYADTAWGELELTLTDAELAALRAADNAAAAALAQAEADAAETPIGYDYEYGYEYNYDYNYDYGYDYEAASEDAMPGPPEPRGEIVAEELPHEERYELYYGYDAQGRPLKNWRANRLAVLADRANATEDYTRGYSPYDDRHADDYAALRAGSASQRERANWKLKMENFQSRAEALAGKLLDAADAAWRRMDAAQYDPYNYAEYGRGEYGFGELEYRSYEYYHADPDDYFGYRDLKAEVADSAPSPVDWRAIEQLAGALDRAGARLQAWSQALNDLACRRFAAARAAQRR